MNKFLYFIISMGWIGIPVVLHATFEEVRVQHLAPLVHKEKNFLTKICSTVCLSHKGWLGEFADNEFLPICYCKDAKQSITIQSLIPLLVRDPEFRTRACSAVCGPYKWWTESWKQSPNLFECECRD